MSETPTTAPDPADFALDAWIDDVARPEKDVKLYPPNPDVEARFAQLQAQAAAAEGTKPEDRGITDASPDAILEAIRELRATYDATALTVRVRQLTKGEVTLAFKAAHDDGVSELDAVLYPIAEAILDKRWTVERLKRLRDRDVSGEAMVEQLRTAVNQLIAQGSPSVPFSPASSTSPAGPGSSGA